MTILADEFSSMLSARYDGFLLSLLGAHKSVQFGTALGVTPYSTVVLALSRAFMRATQGEIDRLSEFMLLGASEQVIAEVTERKGRVLAQVSSILRQNCAQATGEVQKSKVLDLFGVGGALREISRNGMAAMHFRALDSANRLCNSKSLMRSVLRDFAYQSEIDTRIDEIRANGGLSVTLSTGEVIPVATDSDMLELSRVRVRVFHPNSRTTIV